MVHIRQGSFLYSKKDPVPIFELRIFILRSVQNPKSRAQAAHRLLSGPRALREVFHNPDECGSDFSVSRLSISLPLYLFLPFLCYSFSLLSGRRVPSRLCRSNVLLPPSSLETLISLLTILYLAYKCEYERIS